MSHRFEWDPAKALVNAAKHGVTFEEAITVFDDLQAIFAEDPIHSVAEPRFLVLGLSQAARLLLVVHCVREDGDIYRIISARHATRREERFYFRGES